MNRERESLSPEARALLAHEREITPLPATVRARAIARARAALLAGVDRRAPVPMRRPRWAAAAAVIGIMSVGVGAAAYQFRAYLSPPPANDPPAATPRPAPPPVPSAPVAQKEDAPAAPAVDKPVPVAGRPGARRAAPPSSGARGGGARRLRGRVAADRRARPPVQGWPLERGARSAAGEGARRARPERGCAPCRRGVPRALPAQRPPVGRRQDDALRALRSRRGRLALCAGTPLAASRLWEMLLSPRTFAP